MKKSKYKSLFYLINQTYGLKVILKKLILDWKINTLLKLQKMKKKL